MFSICCKESWSINTGSSILTTVVAGGGVLKVGGTVKTAGMWACVTVPMIQRPSQQGGSAHIHGNPAIHMGHCGNDREFYLQSTFHSLSEPFIKTSHVHFVPLNVGEAPFVNEKLADSAELSVVMPEFSSALYPVLPLCVN
jgi:hypothetical protein